VSTLVPIWRNGQHAVFAGDSLRLLREMPDNSVDAVITDPPYSSGGLMRGDRQGATSSKYVMTGTQIERPEFYGDNRDQRSFTLWCSLWMAECARITKQGGYLLTFCDWRQLPAMSDAIQAGGWVWRGIVPWDKTEGTRPQMGWFRAQCEYVLTASNGGMGKEQERPVKVCLPGLFRENVRSSEKLHITGKPIALMRRLMECLPAGSVVLDPFAGSGSTAVAAMQSGMRSISIEMSDQYCEIIKQRLCDNEPLPETASLVSVQQSAKQPDLFTVSES
jgi:site-specific DNA-methyltransferase (adenine-specific)